MYSPKRYGREEMVRVLVGQTSQEFSVNRRLLSACSPYFSQKLSQQTLPSQAILLATESPAMFELFVVWLHEQPAFRRNLDDTINGAISAASMTKEGTQVDACTLSQRLHWALVRLHLFAANLELGSVQDVAMDALQDLYLRRDWDVTPRLIKFLYSQCSVTSSLRLRRWAVAMVAFTLSCTSDSATLATATGAAASSPTVADHFHDLFKLHPEFSADYANHLRKMASSGLDARVKNPQLRVPTNKLRNEERRFAFRQCAFHTHRAAVGERRCPQLVLEARAKRMPIMGVATTEVGESVTGNILEEINRNSVSNNNYVRERERRQLMRRSKMVSGTVGEIMMVIPQGTEKIQFERFASMKGVVGVDIPKPLRRMRSVVAIQV